VQEVRMSRGNSLSGLTVQEIVQLVKSVVVKNQMMQQQQRGQVTYLLFLPLHRRCQLHMQVSAFLKAGNG